LLAALFLAPALPAAPLSDPAVDAFNVRVGTQTFAGLYQFTTNTLLLETAQAIRGLGSDTIKFYLGSNYPRQYYYSLAPKITSLLTLARDDSSCHAVLDMPFRNIIAWAYPFSNSDAPFLDGNYTSTEQANDYREMYDLGRYLLTNYNNSGKTFYLGHWEGDGYLSVNNWSTNPSPAVIQGMIAWENNRQKAIDDAKAGLNFTNVNVYYYAEANRVRDAMLNGPNNNQRLINRVVPYITNLDFLSYSSYDAMNLDSASLYSTLDYMTAKLPSAKASAGLGQRLWIGEYGWGGDSPDAQEPANRAYIQRLLTWGPRFILFWEIYNNETNRNFCLIDPSGAPVASYYLHQRFINLARLETARFKETHGRLPNDSEFAALLGPALNQPLPPPVALALSNLPPALSGASATLTGQLTQGLYGDDPATVWVFWGLRDGGNVRSRWEFGGKLGLNTRFNPSNFSTNITSLALQTNYYFRFYATNSSGEAWAPVSTTLSTRALDPAGYGSRMKIVFSGYDQPGGLLNSPILVELSTNLPGFRYEQFASATGGDLRFTDAGGTSRLAHEIDEWHSDGTSLVWVQSPQLTGPTNYIWAYWGNPLETNPPPADGSAWFPQYQAVWHLNAGAFPYADSVQQHPILSGNAPASTTGVVGRGVVLNGTGQYLDAGVVNLEDSFTLSAWIKIDPDAAGIQTIWANKKAGWNSDGFALYVNSYLTSDRKLLFESGNGTVGQTASTSSNAVAPGIWHHIAATVDKVAGAAHLYVDGLDRTQSGAVQPDFNSGAEMNLGRFTDGTYYFKGALDEARIARGISSPTALWLDWTTVSQNSVLSDYASVVLEPVFLALSVSDGNWVAGWSAAGVGRALLSATNLAPPVLWTRVTNAPALLAGQWQVLLPPETNGTRFLSLGAP
jgi:hypothetical protein